MAVVFLIEIPGFTPEQSAAVLQALGLDKNPAVGQVMHLEGPMDGGMRVVDVWESEEASQAFVRDRLAAAFEKAGTTFPADMQPNTNPRSCV
jgi:hypothetical protein